MQVNIIRHFGFATSFLCPHYVPTNKRSVRRAVPDDLIPKLLEISLDVGRSPSMRSINGSRAVLTDMPPLADLNEAVVKLARAKGIVSGESCTQMLPFGQDSDGSQLKSVLNKLFDQDNRMGLPGTLHRISAMRTRDGGVSGITYRVGRHLPGVAMPLKELLHEVAGAAAGQKAGGLLLVGPPGAGKSTLLRDIACAMADGHKLAVVVVDTNMELGGVWHG
jgi:stage III sporulation protein SpoIIIAA